MNSSVPTLAEDIRDQAMVDAIIVHELSHHALHLAGYRSPGHAWPMHTVERILFQKLGLNFDSIMWDAQHNWPEQTFWRTWFKNMDHEFVLYAEAENYGNVIVRPIIE